MLIRKLLDLRAALLALFSATSTTPSPPMNHETQSTQDLASIPKMPPNSRPTGFVPPHLLREISKSDACSPENRQAATETLKHDESRAVTPKRSQHHQDSQDSGASSGTEGSGEIGKSDDEARGPATAAGGKNPNKKATENKEKRGET